MKLLKPFNNIKLRGVIAGKITLVQQALAILRRSGVTASVYLPGIGTLSGLQTANYLDSLGTTIATTDGPVGLTLNAANPLGPELVTNGSFSTNTTGWSPAAGAGLASVAGELEVTSVGATYGGAIQSIPVTNGKTYIVSWTARRGPLNRGAWLIISGVVGAPINNSVLTQTNQQYTAVVTASSATISLTAQCNNQDATTSYFDNISLRELPGIHATQTTTANKPLLRNTAGVYSWQLDGTDYLQLSAPLFAATDDYAVIAAAKPNSASVDGEIFAQRNSAATNGLAPLLRFRSDGKISAFFRDDAGVTDNPASIASYSAGVTVVAACRKTGNVKNVWFNGVLGVVASTALGTTTINTSAIGAGITTGVSAALTGHIYAVVAIKGTVSDAEMLVLQRWVGSLAGVTI